MIPELRKLLATALFASVAAVPLVASDWPQWRGPNRDDVSTEKGLLQQWPNGGPTLTWKTSGLGSGHGGLAVAGGRVFTTGEKGESGLALALDEAHGEVIWRTPIGKSGGEFQAWQVYANKNMVNHHGGVVRVGEYLYGYSDGKGWVCQEFKTGNLVWNDEGVGKGSLTCADGHLYLRSEAGKGVIALVEATPNGYREKGRYDQPNRSSENSWTHPVVANGKLYIRDQDALLCFDVKAK
jgi:outer membrane protein assembly factor BamB